MKMYVSELPKSCEECPCCYYDDYAECYKCPLLLDNEVNINHKDKDCPLLSLAEHDKQVRKEVCEMLDKIIEKYLCKKGRYRESLDISSIIKQVMKENLGN